MAEKNKPPLQLQIEAILKNNPFVEATELVQIADLFPEGAGQEDEYDLSREWLGRIFGYIGCQTFAHWPLIWLTTKIAYHAETHNISYCEGDGLRHRDFTHIITRTQLQYLMYGLGLPMYQEDPECINTNSVITQDYSGRSDERSAVSMETGSCSDEPHPVWETSRLGEPKTIEFDQPIEFASNLAVRSEDVPALRLTDPEPNTIRFYFNEESGAPREIARIGADGIFRVKVDPSDTTAAQFIDCINALLSGMTGVEVMKFNGMVAGE
jgi:hypothetical protein